MTVEGRDLDFAALYRRLDAAEAALRSDALPDEERSRILAERAARLASVRLDVEEDTLPVFGFRVAGERFAFELGAVDEVLPIAGLSPLPGVPASVLGAMLARSRVILVVDLRRLLGLQGGGLSDLTQVLVITTSEGPLGVAVELVDGRMELPRAKLVPSEGAFRFLSEDRCAVLDLGFFQKQVEEP